MAARVPFGRYSLTFFRLTTAQSHWPAVDARAVMVIGREKRKVPLLLKPRVEPSG
jgi:hypothetical protein